MLARDDKPDRTVFRLWVKEEPPPRLSVLLGDCVHNLRSSLDHIVWQLVLANGRSPGKHAQFPILDKPPKGIFSPNDIRGVSEEARALIESVQPYQAGARAREHFLW